MFTFQLWVTQLCSAHGSLSVSTAAAPLHWLLVGLVSSALVSVFSSKLQMSGAEWTSFSHSPFPASKQHLDQCVPYSGSCGMGCHYPRDHHPAIPYCSITSPQWPFAGDLKLMAHLLRSGWNEFTRGENTGDASPPWLRQQCPRHPHNDHTDPQDCLLPHH